MKTKAISVFLFTMFITSLLTASLVSATTLTRKTFDKELMKNSEDHNFGVIAEMKIDPTQEDPDERATVEFSQSSFTIDDYQANDPIRFSVDYEIVHDMKGPWEEAPFPVPPTDHTTTIEKWNFQMRANLVRNNGDIVSVGNENLALCDGAWDTPPEILLVQAPSSVIEGEDFDVLVTFQGYPTYEFNACQNEEVTFNGVTKENDPQTGIVTFTAPEVNSDKEFTIDAFKDWNAVDDHNHVEILTYGSTKITVLEDSTENDLVLTADSSVMEREDFEVLVTKESSPVVGALVFFGDNIIPKITGFDGKVTIDAPEVSSDKEYEISAYHPDFIEINEGRTKITVVADYDDEADNTDESGLSDTMILELNLDRSDFYKPLATEGDQPYTEINIVLKCTRYLWCWKPPKFEAEDTSWDKTATLDIKLENSPPSIEIDGPTQGKAGETYDFTFHAIDPDGDPLHFFEIHWGDGNYIIDNNDYHGFDYDTELTKSHTYESQGDYTITVTVQDAIGDQSTKTLQTTMPKSRVSTIKAINNPILKLLNNLKILELIKNIKN